MSTLLVVANETMGAEPVLDAIARRRAGDPALRVVLCAPMTRPRHGLVVYEAAVREAARVRVELTRAVLRERHGIEAAGEVGDADPRAAALDAVARHRPAEVVLATRPVGTSLWLRRGLVSRVRSEAGVPVEHVIADPGAQPLPVAVTLVVADGAADAAVLGDLVLSRRPHPAGRAVVCLVPLRRDDPLASHAAHRHLIDLVARMRAGGVAVAGMTGVSDPYAATLNACESVRVDEVLVSPEAAARRSGWRRLDVVDRLRRALPCPVEPLGAPDLVAA